MNFTAVQPTRSLILDIILKMRPEDRAVIETKKPKPPVRVLKFLSWDQGGVCVRSSDNLEGRYIPFDDISRLQITGSHGK